MGIRKAEVSNVIALAVGSFQDAVQFWPSPGSAGNTWFELNAVRFIVALDRKSAQLSQIVMAMVAGTWPDLGAQLIATGPTPSSDVLRVLAVPTPLYRTSLSHDARTTGSYSTLLKDYELMPEPRPTFNALTVAADQTTGSEAWDIQLDLYVTRLFPTLIEEVQLVKAQGGAPQRR